MLRSIVVRALVEKIDFLAERDISMGESRRYPQQMMVGLAEHHANPLAEARRAAAYVHRDIEHLAAANAHEFPLRLLDLVMQTAQRMQR